MVPEWARCRRTVPAEPDNTVTVRDLRALPKANLHLHLTGSMRASTVRDLAALGGITLPESFSEKALRWWEAPQERSWSQFQGRYDVARSTIRTSADVRRIVREAAEDNADDGAGWLEIQVDPTSYTPRLGALDRVIEVVLEAAAEAAGRTGIGVGVIVAASWARPPSHAEVLAALAARYTGEGVVGFGLSNDERAGRVGGFARAFRVARDAGLQGMPHSGFFTGAPHVRDCVELLGAHRIGHGINAVEDQTVLGLLASRGVTLGVCLTSYEPLGVVENLRDVPLRQLYDSGVPVALGTDDPLLFETGLADQYALARGVLGFTDVELAELARGSIHGSRAPQDVKIRLLEGVDRWMAAEQ
jgi:adenosine deaminase